MSPTPDFRRYIHPVWSESFFGTQLTGQFQTARIHIDRPNSGATCLPQYLHR
jgi:hypothetical protein